MNKVVLENYSKKIEYKKLVVLSGGLDSTVLLYWLVKKEKIKPENIIAISFVLNSNENYKPNNDPKTIKYQNNYIELDKAKVTAKKLGVEHLMIDLSYLGSVLKFMQESKKHSIDNKEKQTQPTNMPFRNLIMLANAFSFAQINNVDEIYLGYQKQDLYGYWDTTPHFLNALENVIGLNPDAKIKIKTPFITMSKSDEIKIGQEIGVPFEDTWTCYNPITKKNEIYCCNNCPSCKDRQYNFEKAKVKDPLKYI